MLRHVKEKVEGDSNESRAMRYESSGKFCTLVSAGFGGLILLLGVVGEPPACFAWLRWVVVVLIVIGVGTGGRAYIGFLHGADQLRRMIRDDKLAGDKIAEPGSYAVSSLIAYRMAIWILVSASLLTLVLALPQI